MSTKKTSKSTATARKEKPFQVLVSCYVAGVQYGDYAPGLFPEGDVRIKVQLMRERSNPADARAIKVMFGNTKLGYVPSKYLDLVHDAAKDQPRGTVHGILIAHNKSKPLWEKLVLQIRTFNVENDEL